MGKIGVKHAYAYIPNSAIKDYMYLETIKFEQCDQRQIYILNILQSIIRSNHSNIATFTLDINEANSISHGMSYYSRTETLI